MKYAIGFNNKSEFDRACKLLKKAGVIENTSSEDLEGFEFVEDLSHTSEEPKRAEGKERPQMLKSDNITECFKKARKIDVVTAIKIMKEFQIDKDESRAINKLNEITVD